MDPLVETVFNCCWDLGAKFVRWLFDGWTTQKTDFTPLWDETKLHNTSKSKPILIDENVTDLTQTFIFTIPTGLTIADFISRKQAIAQFLKENPNNIKIELTNNNLATVTIYDTSKLNFNYHSYSFDYGGKLRIPIGVSLRDFSTIYWEPVDPNQCHLLIGGSTGAGKSVCLNVIMEYLTHRDDVDLYLQDTKMVDMTEYENAAKVYNSGTDYALETALKLVDEMRNRYQYLRSKGLKDVSCCNKFNTILYVVEELASFNPRVDTDYYRALGELLAKGRAAGIVCVLTTQTCYAEILPGLLKNNITAVIGLRVRTHEASKVISGDYNLLVNLRGRGHGYFLTANRDTEIQVFNI